MTISNDNPDSDGPWYLWKSSIIMISVTIIAIASIAYDVLSQDAAPATGFRIIENGTIMSGDPVDSNLR